MVEKYVLPEKCRADFVKENGVYRKLSTIERYCRRGYLSIVKGYSEEERCAAERRYNADILADARNYDAGLRAEERNRQLEDEQRQFQNDLALLMAKQSIQNTGYQSGDVVNGYPG